jgi:hypothetical protein
MAISQLSRRVIVKLRDARIPLRDPETGALRSATVLTKAVSAEAATLGELLDKLLPGVPVQAPRTAWRSLPPVLALVKASHPPAPPRIRWMHGPTSAVAVPRDDAPPSAARDDGSHAIPALLAARLAAHTPVQAPNLLCWMRIDAPDLGAALRIVARLRQNPDVETAYLQPRLGRQPDGPGDAAVSLGPGHLHAAPDGIGVFGLENPGHGVGFADVENGWEFTATNGELANTHLRPAGTTVPVFGAYLDGATHGTNVLGLVLGEGTDDQPPRRGVAPAATLAALSGNLDSTVPVGVAAGLHGRLKAVPVTADSDNLCDNASAIVEAALGTGKGPAPLSAGDVLLIEAQLTMTELACLPVEALPMEAATIRALVDAGIVVVAAAGDGTQLLDDRACFAPQGAGAFDTGAILVSAGARPNGAPGWMRSETFPTNFGARVDCFAPVSVPAWAPLLPDATFTSTSAAAAIVAGAALAVQAIAAARQEGPGRLSPRDLRRYLRTYGTPGQGKIGVMPDVRAIRRELLAEPDVLLEDPGVPDPADGELPPGLQAPDVADDGARPYAPGSVRSFRAPAIVPPPADVATPTRAVTVRLATRHAPPAGPYTVTLWALPPTTLPMPGALPLGTAELENGVFDDPAKGPPEVTFDVPWSEPGPVLVATVGCADDPAPPPEWLRTLAYFEHQVRVSNNIAWRCEGATQPAADGTHTLALHLRGAPDVAAPAELWVSSLPPGATLTVALPADLGGPVTLPATGGRVGAWPLEKDADILVPLTLSLPADPPAPAEGGVDLLTTDPGDPVVVCVWQKLAGALVGRYYWTARP